MPEGYPSVLTLETAPLIDAHAVKYHWTMFEGDIQAPSIYRGPPTIEREAAWDAVSNRECSLIISNLKLRQNSGSAINISPEYLPNLNKSHGEYMRTKPESGGGYTAMLEYQHQIHCLVSLPTNDQFKHSYLYRTPCADGYIKRNTKLSWGVFLTRCVHPTELYRYTLVSRSHGN